VEQISAKGKRVRAGILISSALLAGVTVAGIAATSAPANAITVTGTVDNNMYCDPGTGWCYQTNPPYNPSFPHLCHWDYKLSNLHSGMYYTGCQSWGASIYPTS
jgi:hypothetical protein